MFPEQYNNTGMIKAHAIFGELKSRTYPPPAILVFH